MALPALMAWEAACGQVSASPPTFRQLRLVTIPPNLTHSLHRRYCNKRLFSLACRRWLGWLCLWLQLAWGWLHCGIRQLIALGPEIT